MKSMEGLTIREMAEKLGLQQPAVKMRLRVAGIKPISYAGPTAIYAPSSLEAISIVPEKPNSSSKHLSFPLKGFLQKDYRLVVY